jgi:hypothetical protein
VSRQYRPSTIYNLNLHRSPGPRTVPLDEVSWWHVRQQMTEISAVGLAFGLVTIALLKLGEMAFAR